MLTLIFHQDKVKVLHKRDKIEHICNVCVTSLKIKKIKLYSTVITNVQNVNIILSTHVKMLYLQHCNHPSRINSIFPPSKED